MTYSADPAGRNVLLLMLAVESNSALAHGEGYLLVGVAAIAVAFGGVFGVLAAFRPPRTFPSYAHSLGLFLAIGGAIAWVAAGSSEGLALFLVFGGIGGALPLAAGYFSFRSAATWCRHAICKQLTHPHTGA